ncbi:MAG TPA: DUF2334 domain-containing protein [Rhizomicrobium sp.]|nr:DUF2334 domain-containing protein [Rhizomicrobium sp.]
MGPRFVLAMALFLAAAAPISQAGATPAQTALVLYTHDNGNYGNGGRLYAIMLANLIGHFPIRVTIESAEKASISTVKAADAVFFLGFAEDGGLSTRLVRALAERHGTTVWFLYDVNRYLNARLPSLGVTFAGVRGMERHAGQESFFDTVTYKGYRFHKYDGPDADADMGVLRVIDARRARVLATIANSKTGEQAPYAVRSGSFWYIADLPFSYTSPRDRYMVIADLLYDMLDRAPSHDDHPALIRLEDVHPLNQPRVIDKLSVWLAARHIPFSIAVIPHYKDPFGRVWQQPQDVKMDDVRAAGMVAALKRAVARDGSLVQHGTTHQFGLVRNANSAVSGDDYEFWDIVHMKPFPELENENTVRERVLEGRDLMLRTGLHPFAFEAPHYQASPLAYRVIASIYPVSYGQIQYYSNDNFPASKADANDGQFFPYVILRDYYGQVVIPEDLGNLQYSKPAESADDILANADAAKVVRGGFASFFFHPFFLEGPQAARAMNDLNKIVTGLQKRGFHFVAAEKLAHDALLEARSVPATK